MDIEITVMYYETDDNIDNEYKKDLANDIAQAIRKLLDREFNSLELTSTISVTTDYD